ncbi:MAG: hypothetical protein A4E27_00861 [Methanobacterium sp. PtaU1.Bin242]|nr:MAG: hypothetical protein A4E27_00861 [Methanobacterium sp. PtaU1.Bin242]
MVKNMSNVNNDIESKKLLKEAYNCKKEELEFLLKKIENELEKDKKNQNILTAKIVVTSKMAVNR